jgi:hypothetical protein
MPLTIAIWKEPRWTPDWDADLHAEHWQSWDFKVAGPDLVTGQLPLSNYPIQVMIVNADASEPCVIAHAFLEVIGRPRVDGRVVGTEYRINPTHASPGLRVPRRPWYVDEDKAWLHVGGRHAATLIQRAPVEIIKPLGSYQIYINGQYAAVDNSTLHFTDTQNSIIENPADIAGALMEKYLSPTVDFNSRATATGTLKGQWLAATAYVIGDIVFDAKVGYTCKLGHTNHQPPNVTYWNPLSYQFGSFWRAREVLNSLCGTGEVWPLSVVIKEKVAIRSVFDSIGMHSQSFIAHQVSDTGAVIWRMFVDTSDIPTSQPERLYRTDGFYFGPNNVHWRDGDGFRAILTPWESIANSFVLRYGYHEPTGTYAYEKMVTPTADNFATEGTLYRTAMSTSVSRYGVKRQYVAEAPWLWRHKAAEALCKWYANQKRERRVTIECTLDANAIDLRPGHVIRFHDDLSQLAVYPGMLGGAAWSGHWFVVVSVTLIPQPDMPIQVRVVCQEGYSLPT